MTKPPVQVGLASAGAAPLAASATSQIPAGALTASARRGPTDMGAVGPRFRYARCECRCGWWHVVDAVRHELMGYAPDAWEASHAADRLERGRPVYWAEDAVA